MKALTLHQPFASLIAAGEKTIETRHWATRHRGPIAIHAGALNGQRLDDCEEEPYRSLLKKHGLLVAGNLPWGAVIAIATLADVQPMTELFLRHLEYTDPDQLDLGYFSPGRYAWVLRDVVPLSQPIPARGHQGLWDWERPA